MGAFSNYSHTYTQMYYAATLVTPVSSIQEQIANYKTVPQHLLYPEQQTSKLEQTFSPQVIILNFVSVNMVLNFAF